MVWLTAGCVMSSCSAAKERLLVRITVANTDSDFMSSLLICMAVFEIAMCVSIVPAVSRDRRAAVPLATELERSNSQTVSSNTANLRQGRALGLNATTGDPHGSQPSPAHKALLKQPIRRAPGLARRPASVHGARGPLRCDRHRPLASAHRTHRGLWRSQARRRGRL